RWFRGREWVVNGDGWVDRKLLGALFFQAEGGIRVRTVTGVQTCALPISDGEVNGVQAGGEEVQHEEELGAGGGREREMRAGNERSEERRVGKEWRSRWATADEKKKKTRTVVWRTISERSREYRAYCSCVS